MNEKILSLVVEALNSDSVKRTINSMLDNQTQNIIEQVSGAIEIERSESEKEKYKLLLSREEDFKKRIEKLESEKSELTADYGKQISKLEAEKNEVIDTYERRFGELTQNYEMQIRELIQKCDGREVEVRRTKEEADRLRIDTDVLRKKYNEMQNDYSFIIEAYDAFLSLGSQTKERLKNIFVSDTLECFISACFDWDNVEGIWNFVRREIIEKSDAEINSLHTIFRFMFHGYNARYPETQYVLISPAVGTKHNSEEQVILGIKTDGIINRVCLEGYKKSNGKIMCKALVEV